MESMGPVTQKLYDTLTGIQMGRLFPSGMESMGPVTQKLYDTLTGIQMGRLEAPEGWLKVIE